MRRRRVRCADAGWGKRGEFEGGDTGLGASPLSIMNGGRRPESARARARGRRERLCFCSRRKKRAVLGTPPFLSRDQPCTKLQRFIYGFSGEGAFRVKHGQMPALLTCCRSG